MQRPLVVATGLYMSWPFFREAFRVTWKPSEAGSPLLDETTSSPTLAGSQNEKPEETNHA
jgi:hypothetical protein